MPYSAEHKHYLEAMGLVPWVRRDHEPISEGTESRTEIVCDIGEMPLYESDFEGATAVVHGSDDANVLLVFEPSASAPMNDGGIELDPSDEQLLLDMLRAIELEPSSVARCFMAAPTALAVSEQGLALRQHIPENIKAVLHLVTCADDIDGDDEASSRTESQAISVPVWRLPHPVWIKQQPVLKRRAWNVLKAVKHSLGNSRH